MTEPEFVLRHPAIDAVCVGEGEVSLAMLMERLEHKTAYFDVPGFWFKQDDGSYIRNKVAPPMPLDDLLLPDLSFIDDRHFFSPMAGNTYKMIFVEGQRGCPRRCTYCCNQLFLDAYRDHKKTYLRKKSIPWLVKELLYLKEHYGFEFFQFTDDDFSLRSEAELREFKKLYTESVALPYWCQLEANNLTDEKVKLLRESGCIAASMGIETGSQRILQDVYKRKTSRKATINAFKLLHKYGIRTSGNIIVGVPHEERVDIFETIELARKCGAKSLNVNIFAPYRGTALRELCVEKGYLDPGFVRDGRRSWEPVLNMPQISKDDILGLVRVFALYAALPYDMFPLIERCETWEDSSEILFAELERLFWEIMEQKGIDYYIPGFDYAASYEKRATELAVKKSAP